MSNKYPRTYHLPWSPGKGADDKIIDSVDSFLNTDLIVTEKIDASNCCFNSENVFARTHSGIPIHPSFNIAKSIHASIKHELPENLDFFGEYCYAKHSIEYSELPGYFLLFGIRDNSCDRWSSWPEIKYWGKKLNLPTVPELGIINVSSEKELKLETEKYISGISLCGGMQEGIVIRSIGSFWAHNFSEKIAKIVRKNHVTTSKHWKSEEIIPNKLKHMA